MDKKPQDSLITTHHEARRDYEVLESLEVGIVLAGCEVKSLRAKKASLAGSFARFEGDNIVISNLYIAPYEQGNRANPEDPTRLRRLLLKRSQIERLRAKTQQKGLALIPLKMYFNDHGIAKIELALGKGKNLYDKRRDIVKRDTKREMDRALKARNRG